MATIVPAAPVRWRVGTVTGMADALALGYHGPPELTPLRVLTEWMLDPWALAILLLAGWLYLAGVRRVRRAGGSWSAGRTAAFCGGGIGLAGIATCSFLAVYWPVLFYVRAVQTIVLLLGVPLFVAMGRPLTLIIDAAPRFGPRLEAIVAGRAARLLTFPAITGMVLVLTPFLLYFTPWFDAGFHSAAVRELTVAILVLPGLVFFWTLLRVDPVPRQYPYLVSLWVTAAEVVGDAVLGLAVIADRNLIAGPYYHAVARPWGPSLVSDQVLGGGALWILGDLIGLPFLAAVLIVMIREDESDARAIDAELDARDADDGLAAALPGGPSGDPLAGPLIGSAGGHSAEPDVGPSGGAPAGTPQPWWETDPRFADRFSPVDPGPAGGQ
jgi:cytochrome c oxidase assembly factor CtaG